MLQQRNAHWYSSWQHRLTEADIPILLKYRKDHLQDLNEQARALDPFAYQILIAGMVAFGWSYHELAATSSKLMDSIRRHTNLQQLVQDMDGGAPEDVAKKKRRCSDFEMAVRPAKRGRPSQSFEEPAF